MNIDALLSVPSKSAFRFPKSRTYRLLIPVSRTLLPRNIRPNLRNNLPRIFSELLPRFAQNFPKPSPFTRFFEKLVLRFSGDPRVPLIKPPPVASRRNSVSTQSSTSSYSPVEDLVSFDSPPPSVKLENGSAEIACVFALILRAFRSL